MEVGEIWEIPCKILGSYYEVTVFRNVTPYSVVDVYQRFRGTYCTSIYHAEDRGSRLLLNVSSYLPNHSVTSQKTVADGKTDRRWKHKSGQPG
jgi:hypothetical protein